MDYPRYDPQSPVTPLTPVELQQIDQLLQTLPGDAVMTLDGMDGFLTAMLLAPGDALRTWPTADWLPQVWGGDGPGGHNEAAPFTSKRQRKATVVQLLRHLRHLDEQLARSPDAWEPVFSVAEQGAQELVDASDWCAGFLQAVDLQPADWEASWDEAELGPLLAPLLLLGGGLPDAPASSTNADDDEAADLDDPVQVDGLSRAVPDGVLALSARRQPPQA